MECSNCKSLVESIRAVFNGQTLCFKCFYCEEKLLEEEHCSVCNRINSRSKLFYCSDQTFKCQICFSWTDMLLKACDVCTEPSSLLYFNVSDEVVCEQCLRSKKFECSLCKFPFLKKFLVPDCYGNLKCAFCAKEKAKIKEIPCENCGSCFGNYYSASGSLIRCLDCYEEGPLRVKAKLQGKFSSCSTQGFTAQEKEFLKAVNKMDSFVWDKLNSIAREHSRIEKKASEFRSLKQELQTLSQEPGFYQDPPNYQPSSEFNFTETTKESIQVLFEALLDEEKFNISSIEYLKQLWSFLCMNSLMGIWLKLKLSGDKQIQVYLCDRLMYFFDFRGSETIRLFTSTISNFLAQETTFSVKMPDEFIDNIRAVMLTSFVKSSYCAEVDEDLEENYESILEATLQETYLCNPEILDGCGVSLMTRTVLIKDYRLVKSVVSSEVPKKRRFEEHPSQQLYKASTLICFLHEFAHILARAKVGNSKEFVKLYDSPKNFKHNTNL